MASEKLLSLPAGLTALYNAQLSWMYDELPPHVLKILQWLICAQRPLKLKEVAETVAIDTEGSARFDVHARSKEPHDVLCMIPHSWITYSEEKDQVMLAHDSVSDFLVLNAFSQINAPEVDYEKERLKLELERERLRYARMRDKLHRVRNARIPERERSPVVKESNHTFRAKNYGPRETDANITVHKDCIVYLFELCKHNPHNLSSNILEDFPLAKYASKYWTRHAQAVEAGTDLIPTSTVDLLMKGNDLLKWKQFCDPIKFWEGLNPDEDLASFLPPLQHAARAGLAKTVQLLLDRGLDVNAQQGRYANALQAASAKGHTQVVRLLLEAGASVNTQGGKYGNALLAALKHGHSEVVSILFECGANIYGPDRNDHENKYKVTSQMIHNEIAEQLLEAGAEVNAQASKKLETTWKVESREIHTRMAQILFESHWDDKELLSALVDSGREEILRTLRENRAEIRRKAIQNAL